MTGQADPPRAADRLDAGTRGAVLALAADAAGQDGVAPLSEAFRLALGDPAPPAPGDPAPPTPGDPAPPAHRDDGVADVPHATHLLAERDGHLAGYAQRAGDGSAELVVAPAQRGRGVGRALLRGLLDLGPTRVWAHGDLPAAGALAASEGLVPVRSLHLMARPLSDADRADPALPPGFRVRAFRPGPDDDAWLAVNAAAFATHPEQGSLTLEDLRARVAKPWFDASGFLLLDDVSGGGAAPRLAAFHWTKVESPPAGRGEVYVLGVHPAYQGRGLAGPLTRLGLAALARRGLGEVVLYVDGDNAAALATYRAQGFRDRSVDVMYAGPPDRATG
ncbi:MAG TPA: mycothiol synthase [Dermatophilaceae bacterium]|nr:mycothiol synthase [Dermatophilaceae bacterium]